VLPLQREISLGAELPQSNLQIRRLAMSTKIFDIHVIDVYLTSTRRSTWVFDTGSVAVETWSFRINEG
jgi:hypothetical protein